MDSKYNITEKDLFDFVFDQERLSKSKIEVIKNNIMEFKGRIKYFNDLFDNLDEIDEESILRTSFIDRNDKSEFIIS
ncbi:MAG: hypothetical protein JEY94_12080 [Melioribacteraceae bacterium]|nr:hypothetical protein [Melioribacteraceae bacterium]